MLAARRGFGLAETNLVSSEFLDAIRWTMYVEQLAPVLEDARRTAATDPPEALMGATLIAFNARRREARDRVKALEAALFPADEVDDDA